MKTIEEALLEYGFVSVYQGHACKSFQTRESAPPKNKEIFDETYARYDQSPPINLNHDLEIKVGKLSIASGVTVRIPQSVARNEEVMQAAKIFIGAVSAVWEQEMYKKYSEEVGEDK